MPDISCYRRLFIVVIVFLLLDEDTKQNERKDKINSIIHLIFYMQKIDAGGIAKKEMS